jgi:hypothetical protein
MMSKLLKILCPLLIPAWLLVTPTQEQDILEIARANPLNVTVNGTLAKYGDPDLAAAVQGLDAIPHPWTVPKMIELFQKETNEFLDKTKQKSSVDPLTAEWKEQQCGYLATILAASRDPRACIVLMNSFESSQSSYFPGAMKVITGLRSYFVSNPHYHRLPRKEPGAASNLIPLWISDVKEWWKLNKEEVTLKTQ